jgi:hypothetical protein
VTQLWLVSLTAKPEEPLILRSTVMLLLRSVVTLVLRSETALLLRSEATGVDLSWLGGTGLRGFGWTGVETAFLTDLGEETPAGAFLEAGDVTMVEEDLAASNLVAAARGDCVRRSGDLSML